MKMKLIAGLILAGMLLVSGPVFGRDSRGGGGGGFRGGGGFSPALRGSSFSGGRSLRTPSFAFGGSSGNYRGYSGGRGSRGSAYAFGSHAGWNSGRDYNWRGHHYRWYGNGWYIVDPYDYYDYPYYGYGPGYYDGYSQPGNVVYGSEGDSGAAQSVPAEVQQDLARQGYYHGPIDGIVGPMTEAAIEAYQRDNGLRVTGTINGKLLDALDLE